MTILCGGKVIIGQFGNGTRVGRGTITVVLERDRKRYLITAGHNVGEEGAQVYAPKANNMNVNDGVSWSHNDRWDHVGKVERNLYVKGHNEHDVALVRLQNLPDSVDVFLMRVAVGDNFHNLAGFHDINDEGVEVEFVGWRTGRHRAVVTSLDARVRVKDEFDHERLLGGTKQLNIIGNTRPMPGDSGAPVFIGDQLVGIFTAGNRGGDVHCAFTPIRVILEEMNWF